MYVFGEQVEIVFGVRPASIFEAVRYFLILNAMLFIGVTACDEFQLRRKYRNNCENAPIRRSKRMTNDYGILSEFGGCVLMVVVALIFPYMRCCVVQSEFIDGFNSFELFYNIFIYDNYLLRFMLPLFSVFAYDFVGSKGYREGNVAGF